MTIKDTLRLVRSMLESDAADRSIIEACVKLVDDAEWDSAGDEFVDDAYREDGDTGFDRGRAQGFQEGVLQGKRDLDTVAKARDEIATKLHELGKRITAAPLTAAQKKQAAQLEAALGWIAKRPPAKADRSARHAWKESELLPLKPCWCVVKSRDGKHKADAYWDGDDFVIAQKRRLVNGEKWAEIKVRRGVK